MHASIMRESFLKAKLGVFCFIILIGVFMNHDSSLSIWTIYKWFFCKFMGFTCSSL